MNIEINHSSGRSRLSHTKDREIEKIANGDDSPALREFSLEDAHSSRQRHVSRRNQCSGTISSGHATERSGAGSHVQAMRFFKHRVNAKISAHIETASAHNISHMSRDQSPLAKRIKHRADKVGISIRALGLQAGGSARLVQNIIDGTAGEPSASRLEAIARILKTTSVWLLREEGPEEAQPPTDAAKRLQEAMAEAINIRSDALHERLSIIVEHEVQQFKLRDTAA